MRENERIYNLKSNCCQAPVYVRGKTTQYYVCTECNEPCDIEKIEGGDNETL